jgi:hypothetical protein
MNQRDHSSGPAGKGRRRRRRPGSQSQNAQPQGRNQQRQDRHNRQNNPGGIYTAPMDHSYRASQGDTGNGRRQGRPGFSSTYTQNDPDPVPGLQDAKSKIFAFVEDLFFLAKIQETARKMNVKVEFVKTEKDLLDRIKENGEEKPSLLIFDLNNANIKPLVIIPKLKTKLKKGTSFIGFLSHIQGELKLKAQEAGCDMVVPRSAFSQNLPQLLRRHGAAIEVEETAQPGM